MTLEAQNNQQQQTSRSETVRQGQANIEIKAEDLTAIISNVQNVHIDIKIPKFQNEIDKNSVEFIEEMQKFLKTKNIKGLRGMSIVEHALEGKANLWYSLTGGFTDFENFKEKFLEEFYSVPIRVRFKKLWMERRYEARNDSLQTYFYQQLAKARYFIPKLSDYEVNYNIIQQYPPWVKETLSTINYSNVNVIAQTLGNLDAVRRERENKQTSNNYQVKNNGARISQINVRESGNNYQDRRQYDSYNNNHYRGERYYRRSNRGYERPHLNYNVYDHRQGSNFALPDTRFPPPQPQSNNQRSNHPSSQGNNNNNNTTNDHLN